MNLNVILMFKYFVYNLKIIKVNKMILNQEYIYNL